MKAKGIILVAGAAGALALIGLALLPASSPSESSAQPSRPEARAPSSPPPGADPGVTPGGSVRPGAAPPPSAPLAATQESGARGEAPPSPPPASPQPEGSQGAPSASASTQAATASAVMDRLDISRKARTEEERIRALEWLANNAEIQHFDAIQDIQINDPSPEVRKAAEAAISAVMRRHRDTQAPEERVVKDPQGYMRDVQKP